MGWKEIEAERRRIMVEKDGIRKWRDAEIKAEEAKRKAAHVALEQEHAEAIDQIKNSAIEQFMRLDDGFLDFKKAQQR